MKSLVIALTLAVVFAEVDCPKNCYPYDGACACDAPADKAPDIAPPTSDEKPPTEKMPSYERPGIKADMPQRLIYMDSQVDKEQAAADAEGKQNAGVK